MKITDINRQDNRNLNFGAGLKYTKALQQIAVESGKDALPKTFDGMNNFIVTPNSKLKDLITKSSFFSKTRKSADMFVTEYKEKTESSIMNYFNVYFKKNKNSEKVETINFKYETENEDVWYNELKSLIGQFDEYHEYIFGNKKLENDLSAENLTNNAVFLQKMFKNLPENIVNKIWEQKELTKAEQKMADEAVQKVAEEYKLEELEKIDFVKIQKVKIKNKTREIVEETNIETTSRQPYNTFSTREERVRAKAEEAQEEYIRKRSYTRRRK